MNFSDQLETIFMSLLSLLEAGNYLDDTDGYQQASDEMLINQSLTDFQ